MKTRDVLPDDKRSDEVHAQLAAFHPRVVGHVKQAVSSHRVVVVGMARNPFVKKARNALDAAGVSFEYLEFGGYASQWKERLAIKMWSGYPTFPQVFVDGVLIGGFTELQAALAKGTLATASRS